MKTQTHFKISLCVKLIIFKIFELQQTDFLGCASLDKSFVSIYLFWTAQLTEAEL